MDSPSIPSLRTSNRQVTRRTLSPTTLPSNTKHGRLGNKNNMRNTRHRPNLSHTLSVQFLCHTYSPIHQQSHPTLLALSSSHISVRHRCPMHSQSRRSRNPTTTQRSGKLTITSTRMRTTKSIHRCAAVCHSLPSSPPHRARPTAINRRHNLSPRRSTTTRRSGRPTTTRTRRSTTRSIPRCAKEPCNSHSPSLSHSNSSSITHSAINPRQCRGCNSLRAGTLVLKTRVPLPHPLPSWEASSNSLSLSSLSRLQSRLSTAPVSHLNSKTPVHLRTNKHQARRDS